MKKGGREKSDDGREKSYEGPGAKMRENEESEGWREEDGKGGRERRELN